MLCALALLRDSGASDMRKKVWSFREGRYSKPIIRAAP